MDSASFKSEYLLLFRGTDWYRGLTAEEIKKIMTAWMAWSDRLVAEGRSKARRSLGGTSKVVSGSQGAVFDGPYPEAKETIAGYFLLELDDIDEALEIARECPLLAHGMKVEVRPLRERCLASELAAAPIEAIGRFIASQDVSVLRIPTLEPTF
jgi:hypothetical protein